MRNLVKLAFRNLGRHRRRSLLTALALAITVALLLFMAAFFKGEMLGSLEDTLKLSSGHLQVRNSQYDPDKASVAWEYLIENPQQVADQLAASPQVALATPRLAANGILSTGSDSLGVQILGVDPASPANQPYRLLAGAFPTADDRSGILIGAPLAEALQLGLGDTLNLAINTANGTLDEQNFNVRGIYSTGASAYDKGVVLLPLAKAQAFSRAGERASFIFVMLHDREQAAALAASLSSQRLTAVTWREMNELLVTLNDFSDAYLMVLNLIILGVTMTVVVNTLLMAVFERTREIGILSALGMKSHQVVALFLSEAALLALGGVTVGLLVGWALSAYYGKVGLYFGDLGLSGLVLGDRIYTYLLPEDALTLTLLTFIVTLAASYYPARLAARLEPAEALRAEK